MGEVVTVLEQRQESGHERVRIGPDQWISRVTNVGKVLAQPYAGGGVSDIHVPQQQAAVMQQMPHLPAHLRPSQQMVTRAIWPSWETASVHASSQVSKIGNVDTPSTKQSLQNTVAVSSWPLTAVTFSMVHQ